MDESKEVRQIPIEDIIPNRFQPRINFDEKALNELSESIKQHGIIQPLVLRPLGDKFEIIAGERRYKAATLAGLATVPGIVTEMDDNTSAEVALIENVQRKDLSSIEEAKSYKSMLERSGMTQEELAKKMGLSQSTIANKLRLLNLSEEVQTALTQEKISERHARALLAISNKEDQVKWLDRIIKERLTVRQLDLAIKDELNAEKELGEDIPKVNINPDIQSIINNAVDINTGTPVNNSTNNETNIEQETQEIPKTTNKFFNYLEDEEVNMSTSEETKEEKNDTSAPAEVFSFTPEFQNAPENTFAPQPTDEIDTLDDLDTTNVETAKDEPIFSLGTQEAISNEQPQNSVLEQTVAPKQAEPIQEVQTSEPQVINSEPTIVQEDQVINEVVETPEVVQQPEPEEFIFDDDDGNTANSATPVKEETPVEPIPIMEGDGVIDPAAYYDTLDPNFMDKVKEYVGLDLKNAINSYRELTDDLNKKGFNISIEESDLDNKYYIEININKE